MPKSREFARAISETQDELYARYHPMAEAAEKAGVRVDASPAMARMQQLIDEPLTPTAARAAARRLLKTAPSGRPRVDYALAG